MICIHIKKQNEYRKEYCKPKWLVKSCENIGYYTFKNFHFFSPLYSSWFSFLFQIFKTNPSDIHHLLSAWQMTSLHSLYPLYRLLRTICHSYLTLLRKLCLPEEVRLCRLAVNILLFRISLSPILAKNSLKPSSKVCINSGVSPHIFMDA